jgi:hypothetical protein
LYAREIVYFTLRERTYVKTRLHKFSKNLGVASKLWAPEGGGTGKVYTENPEILKPYREN